MKIYGVRMENSKSDDERYDKCHIKMITLCTCVKKKSMIRFDYGKNNKIYLQKEVTYEKKY